VSIQSSHKILPIGRMRFKLTFLIALTAGVGFVGVPRRVEAQESAVLAIVSELAADSQEVSAVHDRFSRALAEWDRQIATLRSRADTFQEHVDLGMVYRRRGQLPRALEQFDAAAALRPDASDVQLLRALTLEAAGRLEEAGRAYHTAWSRDEANPVKAYLTLRRTPNLAAAAAARATAALRDAYSRAVAGNYRSSTPPFLTLDLVLDSMFPSPLADRGGLARVYSLLAAGRLDDAAVALRSAPSTGTAESSAARIQRGGTAEQDGRLADARREYIAAIEGTLAGRHALYVGIGRLAQVEGDADAAVDAFENAVRLNPNVPALRRECGAALVAAGRFGDAFAEFVMALLMSPDDAELLAAVGQMFLDTDRAPEAIAPLRRALAVNAHRYQTHYALATALARAGRAGDAAREFREFERLSRQAIQDRRRVVAGQP
jgi:tetratricopeptide (TPR) repeat protein